MKKAAICAFLISSAFVSAQKATVFEIKIQPEKKYSIESVSLNNINMDVPSQGPMSILQETKTPFTMTTSKAAADARIPAEIKYGEATMKQTFNGQAMDQKNPASGMSIVGTFDKASKFTMESVKGENISEEVKTLLNSMLENGLKQINFPTKALAIGESFDDSMPLKIPLAQLGTLNATIKTTYTLTKVEKGLGHFDTKLNMTMDTSETSSLKATATGSGKGKLEVSLADKYFTKNSAVMDMDMTLEVQGMQIVMKTNSTTSNTATVSKL